MKRDLSDGATLPVKPTCEEGKCTFPPCANCGHPHDDHLWFNSEFIDCGHLGRRTTTVVAGVVEHHQLMANCECENYKPSKDKTEAKDGDSGVH